MDVGERDITKKSEKSMAGRHRRMPWTRWKVAVELLISAHGPVGPPTIDENRRIVREYEHFGHKVTVELVATAA